MTTLLKLATCIAIITALGACDTLDSDYPSYDLRPWHESGPAPSGDNRTHEQRLSDDAWWAEYNRQNY